MVTTKSLEKQTPGNLDANKMLLGTYGWSGGKRVDGEIYSQEGIILNPGTTEKTGMVIGKYLLDNITVPANQYSGSLHQKRPEDYLPGWKFGSWYIRGIRSQ